MPNIRAIYQSDKEGCTLLNENTPCQHPNNLTPAEYQELAVDSAIHPALIEHNFIHISGEEVYPYLFSLNVPRKNAGRVTDGFLRRYQHAELGGWWVSGLDPLNNWQQMEWGRFKPTYPRVDEKGKPVKYESPPKTPNRVTYLDVSDCIWDKVAKRYGIECDRLSVELQSVQLQSENLSPTPPLPLSPPPIFWEWVLAHPEIPIILCEGEKKAACLLSLGFVAIALPGIWNGRVGKRDFDERLHPDLLPLAQPGRKFIILFDYEEKPKTRWNVFQATLRTGRAIEAAGSLCEVAQLPGREKGVDDFVVARGGDASALLTAIIDDAKSLKDYQRSFHLRHRGLSKKYPADIRINVKYLSEAVRLPDRGLVVLSSVMGTGKTELLKKWLEEHPEVRFLNNGHRVNLLKNLAERLKTEMYSDLGYAGLAKAQALSITIDSLHKLNTDALTYGCVFIDEACQYLTHLLHSKTCKQYRAQILEVLEYIVYNARLVVIADAHMDDVTVDFFMSMRPKDEKPLIVVNDWKNGDRPIYWYEGSDSSALVAQISAALMTGQKIMVASDSKRFIKKLEKSLNMPVQVAESEVEPEIESESETGFGVVVAESGDAKMRLTKSPGKGKKSTSQSKTPQKIDDKNTNNKLDANNKLHDARATHSENSEMSGNEKNVAFIKDTTNAVGREIGADSKSSGKVKKSGSKSPGKGKKSTSQSKTPQKIDDKNTLNNSSNNNDDRRGREEWGFLAGGASPSPLLWSLDRSMGIKPRPSRTLDSKGRSTSSVPVSPLLPAPCSPASGIDLRIWAIHSENSGSEENVAFIKDITNAVKRLDALLTSPSLGTGVDISDYHFDAVFGVFHGVSQTATECVQQLYRYRPKVPIHVWVAPRPPFGYKETNATKIKERLLQTNEITAFLLKIDRETGKRGVEKDWALEAYCQIQAQRHQSINNLRTDLRDLLVDMGNHIIPMGTDDNYRAQEKLKDAAKALDAAYCAFVAKAKDISPSIYRQRQSKDYLKPEEVFECEKFRIKDTYGMEVTAELVEKDQGGKLSRAIAALEAVISEQEGTNTDPETGKTYPLPPAIVAEKDRQERLHLPLCMDWGNYSAQWLARSNLGLINILKRLIAGEEITAADPELLQMTDVARQCANHIKAILGFRVPANCKPIWLLGTLLDQLGLKLKNHKVGPKGKQVKHFLLDPEEWDFAKAVIKHRENKRAQKEEHARQAAEDQRRYQAGMFARYGVSPPHELVSTPPPNGIGNPPLVGVDTTGNYWTAAVEFTGNSEINSLISSKCGNSSQMYELAGDWEPNDGDSTPIKTSLQMLRDVIAVGVEAVKTTISHWSCERCWCAVLLLEEVAAAELRKLEQMIPNLYGYFGS